MQAWPQVPQWAGSVVRFTHPAVAPQSSGHALPASQPQTPAGDGAPFDAQTAWGGQRWLHPPQFHSSVRVLTHTTAGDVRWQSVAAAVPAQAHAPAVQIASAPATPVPAQTTPQLPQYPPSPVARFTQAPGFVPQVVGSAPGQLQAPPVQTPPTGQRAAQAPQLRASVWRSTGEPQHVSPAGTVTPQPPQFAGSRLASTQRSPHRISGAWHSGPVLHPAARTAATSTARRKEGRFTGP